MKLKRKKLRSACFTLAIVLIFSAISIICSISPSFRPANVSTSSPAILIAYRDVQLLEHDLNYLESTHASYSLPGSELFSTKTNISIIIEMQDINDTLESVKLLSKHRIPAVITLFKTMNKTDMELIRNEYVNVKFEFALYYDCFSQNCIEFCTELNEARLEYYMNFDESCKNIILSDGSQTIDDISYLPVHLFDNLSIIGFGNGINYNYSGINLYNRIVRIPEISMEQYFSEIAH